MVYNSIRFKLKKKIKIIIELNTNNQIDRHNFVKSLVR